MQKVNSWESIFVNLLKEEFSKLKNKYNDIIVIYVRKNKFDNSLTAEDKNHII